MLSKMKTDRDFSDLMQIHVREMLEYLLRFQYRFDVYAMTEFIEFDPELPEEITRTYTGSYLFFTIANYTLTTAGVSEDFFTFNAGFGAQNFPAHVKIPLGAIAQIRVDGAIIFISQATYKDILLRQDVERSKKKFLAANKDNPLIDQLQANANKEEEKRAERNKRFGFERAEVLKTGAEVEEKKKEAVKKRESRFEMMKRAIEFAQHNEKEDKKLIDALQNVQKQVKEAVKKVESTKPKETKVASKGEIKTSPNEAKTAVKVAKGAPSETKAAQNAKRTAKKPAATTAKSATKPLKEAKKTNEAKAAKKPAAKKDDKPKKPKA